MKESKNIDQFMTRVMRVVNQLQIHGMKIEDKIIVEKIIRSLPKKIEMVFIAIEESKDLSKLTVQELMGSLLSHESRINMEEGSLEHAFNTQVLIVRGIGRGNRGRSSPPTQGRTTIEQSKQSNKPKSSQNQRGRNIIWV